MEPWGCDGGVAARSGRGSPVGGGSALPRGIDTTRTGLFNDVRGRQLAGRVHRERELTSSRCAGTTHFSERNNAFTSTGPLLGDSGVRSRFGCTAAAR